MRVSTPLQDLVIGLVWAISVPTDYLGCVGETGPFRSYSTPFKHCHMVITNPRFKRGRKAKRSGANHSNVHEESLPNRFGELPGFLREIVPAGVDGVRVDG